MCVGVCVCVCVCVCVWVCAVRVVGVYILYTCLPVPPKRFAEHKSGQQDPHTQTHPGRHRNWRSSFLIYCTGKTGSDITGVCVMCVHV